MATYGNIERLAACAAACRVGGIEEHAADDGAEDPSDAVTGLREVDAGGGVAQVAQHGSVGVGDGLKERQARGDQADARQERHESHVW